jgi:uncharacterized membrane protein YczE
MIITGCMILYWGYSAHLGATGVSLAFATIETLMLDLGMLFGYIGIYIGLGTIVTIIVIGAMLIFLKFQLKKQRREYA